MTQGTVIRDKDSILTPSNKMLIGVFYRVEGGQRHNAIACRIMDDIICFWSERDGFKTFFRRRVENTLDKFVEIEEFVFSSGKAVNEKS